jgi:hypothetical protein
MKLAYCFSAVSADSGLVTLLQQPLLHQLSLAQVVLDYKNFAFRQLVSPPIIAFRISYGERETCSSQRPIMGWTGFL